MVEYADNLDQEDSLALIKTTWIAPRTLARSRREPGIVVEFVQLALAFASK